ncbi:MAG TPA: hypothetical protein VIG42_09615, partial [Solirubrobacteraceae bacterium]
KSWEQVPLPADLRQVNFTSIAFAGGEALATYRTIATEADGEQIEIGGVAVEEDGSGEHWHIDEGAAALLAQLPSVRDAQLSKVAGLSDGGAVAGGPGLVIERESTGSPWRLSSEPLPEAKNVSALAAYREAGGPVRAIVSVELDRALDPGQTDGNLPHGAFAGDVPPATGAGQPPVFFPPDPLPDSGYLLKETAHGWVDLEHRALPARQTGNDMPIRPDPVLAVLADQSGEEGLAVGGQTYDSGGRGPETAAETAAAQRFPAAAGSQDGLTPVPLDTPPGQASFVVAGGAVCAGACADLANDGIGPDVWLAHALAMSSQLAGGGGGGGLRAFLYTGGRLPNNATYSPGIGGEGLGLEAFQRELERFGSLLTSSPVRALVAPSADVEPPGIGSEPFARALRPSKEEAGYGPAGAYSIMAPGSAGGPVKVIVLDTSSGEVGSAQRAWLEEELFAAVQAKVPAIVMGGDALGFKLPQAPEGLQRGVQEARDAAEVSRILVKDHASAYLFDYPSNNVKTEILASGIPAYGTGTLGYVEVPGSFQRDSLGSSGFLLLSVDTAKLNPVTNIAPVRGETVPNIGQLSLNATDGVLLARSKVAVFEGLARRPPAGVRIGAANGAGGGQVVPDVYDPIPFDCQGTNCPLAVPIDYTFSSTKPDVGGFVLHEASSANADQVQLGANGLPIPDEPRNAKGELNADGRFQENGKGERLNERGEVVPADPSGTFCAYNEGTTVISISAGGLTYSEPITVRGGSVEYPCGTVPLKNPPARVEPASSNLPAPSTPPSPAPFVPQIQVLAPPVPLAPPAIHRSPTRPHPPSVPLLAAAAYPVLALVPPPAPTVARPTPPSGTAPVTVPTTVAQHEEEEEGAIEEVHNMAAYSHSDGNPIPVWPLALIPFALAAALGLRPRSRTPQPGYARAIHDSRGSSRRRP